MCAAGVFENERVYFAYGSNLHPLRVIDRLGSDIRLLGIAEVGGYRLEFSKRSSTDGSATGARYPRFPVAYVDVIEQTPFDVDRDEARKRKNERVLAQLASKPSDD